MLIDSSHISQCYGSKHLEYVDPKTPLNDHVRLEMWCVINNEEK